MLRVYRVYMCLVAFSTYCRHMLYSRMFTQNGACVYINAALVFSSDSSESRELPQSACVASLCCFLRIAPASKPTPIAASRRSFISTSHLYSLWWRIQIVSDSNDERCSGFPIRLRQVQFSRLLQSSREVLISRYVHLRSRLSTKRIK